MSDRYPDKRGKVSDKDLKLKGPSISWIDLSAGDG